MHARVLLLVDACATASGRSRSRCTCIYAYTSGISASMRICAHTQRYSYRSTLVVSGIQSEHVLLDNCKARHGVPFTQEQKTMESFIRIAPHYIPMSLCRSSTSESSLLVSLLFNISFSVQQARAAITRWGRSRAPAHCPWWPFWE